MNRTSSDISLQWVSESPGKRVGFSKERKPICDHPPHHSGFRRPDLSRGTAPPDADPAGYEEFRAPGFPKALRTRPRVTWNRFALFEGLVVSPRLLPPPNSVVMATAVGGGGWTAELLARLPGMLRFHPVFSLAALQADRGRGRPCPVTRPPRVHPPGPPPPRLSRTALRPGTFRKMGLTENDTGALSGAPWS